MFSHRISKAYLPAFFLLIIVGLYTGCSRTPSASAAKEVKLTILQMNDVYEIAPLSGGKEGGLARVATIRKQLLKENPHTITVMAGDFLSPSLMGTLKLDGRTVAGRQMVDVLNETGVDYVTFGNHEFDIKKYQLQERINESRFDWFSCNVLEVTQEGISPFSKVTGGERKRIPRYIIHRIRTENGSVVKVGMIGVTIPANKADSVRYEEVYASAEKVYQQIADSCDVLIALTHLTIEMDLELARRMPKLTLIMGGHEHVNMKEMEGNVTICKADANAKSVYIHELSIDPVRKQVSLSSRLQLVDERIASDGDVNNVVQKWLSQMDQHLKASGYDVYRKILSPVVPLDGRESAVRYGSTNFTRLISNAMLYVWPQAEVAVFNSGSIRLDDELSGDVTEFDILRSLPFGGALAVDTIPGGRLVEMLETGTGENRGSGGFLQYAGAVKKGGIWYVNQMKVDQERGYVVVLPSYLADGKEKNLGFVREFHGIRPAVFREGIRNDVRDVVIAYIKSGMKEPLWE